MKISEVVAGQKVVTTVELLGVPSGTAGKIAKNFGSVSGETVFVEISGKGKHISFFYKPENLTAE